MKGTLDFKGLTNWLEDLQRASQNVDQAVSSLLNETQPFVADELRTNLLKTRQTNEEWTGDLERTLDVSDVKQEGNYVFIEASIGGTSSREAAVYKEFGNTRQAAEPFFRTTFRSHRLRNRLRQTMKELSEGYGLKA